MTGPTPGQRPSRADLLAAADKRVAPTNLVDRATAAASELTREDLRAGARDLARTAQRYAPAYVAVLGVTAYRVAFDEPKATLGPQAQRLGRSALWVLPSPSGLNAHHQPADLSRLFGELREAAS